jgi:predicted nuclease of predicted toxin-antitoxin system
VRLLLDQNLPYSITRAIADGWDAIHTEDVNLQRVTEPEIFRYCIETDRVLVTADKKLTKFLASSRASAPSVVILRGFVPHKVVLADALVRHLPQIEEAIGTVGDAIFSIAPDRPVRVQRLPLGIAAPVVE